MKIIYTADIDEDTYGLAVVKDVIDEALVAEGFEITESTINEDGE